MAALIQFVEFGIMDIGDTAFSYVIEMPCYCILFVDTQAEGVKKLPHRFYPLWLVW